MASSPQVQIRRACDATEQSWSSPQRGAVNWWELFGGDVTPTGDLTLGIAEIPPHSPIPTRGHTHDAVEVYVIMAGRGSVYVDGIFYPVNDGDAVWIPEHAEHFVRNDGDQAVRLLYIFARDKFSDVHYCFPGEDA